MKQNKDECTNHPGDRPAIVTVGDELVLGEQENHNQLWLLREMAQKSYPAEVALSLPDNPEIISENLIYLLHCGNKPIIVSGGIGGTHDDCTRLGIAKSLGVPLTLHQECHKILANKFGSRYNDQKQRMSCLPQGSQLINNPIGAPGFFIKGIYAFPGFPSMLKPMFGLMIEKMFDPTHKQTDTVIDYVLPVSEGRIAILVESFMAEHLKVKIGIYPNGEKMGKELTIRLRHSINDKEIRTKFEKLIREYAK